MHHLFNLRAMPDVLRGMPLGQMRPHRLRRGNRRCACSGVQRATHQQRANKAPGKHPRANHRAFPPRRSRRIIPHVRPPGRCEEILRATHFSLRREDLRRGTKNQRRKGPKAQRHGIDTLAVRGPPVTYHGRPARADGAAVENYNIAKLSPLHARDRLDTTLCLRASPSLRKSAWVAAKARAGLKYSIFWRLPHAKSLVTTFPETSVSRKSRPWER